MVFLTGSSQIHIINVFSFSFPPFLWLQGVLGIKVKIMLDWDPKGKVGPTTPLPDVVTIHTPKEEEYTPAVVTTPLELPVA